MTDPSDSIGTTDATIAAATSLGPVHLTVSDLGRSVSYYEQAIGLSVRERSDDHAVLGTGADSLLVLVQERGARPADGYTGLYHVALLLPTRADLAAWIAHGVRDRVALTGMSDHFVSEALYLRDPDGHGIEIYADRPRGVWEGIVAERMTSVPLDVDAILTELPSGAADDYTGMPDGTVMGHVHLRVADIAETVAFYEHVLGFELMAQLGTQAAFLAAGGYHHHIGANTWESAGAPPAPHGFATLRHATLQLPDEGERKRVLGRLQAGDAVSVQDTPGGPLVRDPSGNAWVLAVG